MAEANTWSLVITGNQEDPYGNPIPYERMTQRSKWKPRNKRYLLWKSYIVGCWLEIFHKPPRFLPGETYRLDVICYFKGEAHADPDNCRKAVQDALFSNDKHIWGFVSFAHVEKSPGLAIGVKKETPSNVKV